MSTIFDEIFGQVISGCFQFCYQAEEVCFHISYQDEPCYHSFAFSENASSYLYHTKLLTVTSRDFVGGCTFFFH